MFTDKSVHNIDSKGRVSIPAEMRTEMHRQSKQTPMLMKADGHLEFYPFEVWKERADRLIQGGFPELEAVEARLFIGGNTKACAIDNQGRILIPPDFREEAGLRQQAMVIGALDHIQIWEPGLFDSRQQSIKQRWREICRDVAKAGL